MRGDTLRKKSGFLYGFISIYRNNGKRDAVLTSPVLSAHLSLSSKWMYILWYCSLSDDRRHTGEYIDYRTACICDNMWIHS